MLLADLKLKQKGALMVGVPLLLGIAYIIWLAGALQTADNEKKFLKHHQKIKRETISIVKTIIKTAQDLEKLAVMHEYPSIKDLSDAITEAELHLSRLKDEVKDDPKEVEYIQKAAVHAEDAFAILKKIKKEIGENNATLSANQFQPYMKCRTKLEDSAKKAYAALNEIIVRQEEIESSMPDIDAEFFKKIRFILIAGLVLMVLLAITMLLYIDRNTIGRLEVVLANIGRFQKSETAALEAVTGKDEIGELDRHFRHMATELAESMRKQRMLTDNAADVICSIDTDGKFTNVSPFAENVWGLKPEQLIGANYIDLVSEEDRIRTQKSFEQLKATKTGSFENKVRRADGSQVDVQWSGQWVDSEKTAFMVVHDITERKEVERIKQQFVATVSHELRTPLTSVKGVLALILEGAYGKLEKNGMKMVGTAESEITRLMKLINDLLDVAKMEAAGIDLVCEKIPIEIVVNRAVESVRIFARNHEVEIVEGDLPDVFAFVDGDRLVQVLINLISNAVKFSPAGGTVIVEGDEIDGDAIELRVIDQGRGIPPSMCDAIFERFKQVEAADARKKGGTGLGLAISKTIVEKHGGEIGVRSKVGEGSTFWFRIPKKAAVAVKEKSEPVPTA